MRRKGHNGGMSPFSAGLLAIVIVVVACFFAFSQTNPFSKPYSFKAEFNNAANVKPNAAVRIAGVEVGKVKSVETKGRDGGGVMEIQVMKKGLPLHKDAQIKLRPRIFLEGNMFVDIQPGSPDSPELKSGQTIPASQTSAPVQFEEVLRTLQSDTRKDLQTLLKEFSAGLDKGGAEAFNRSIPYWEPAYKYSSQANEASLGTEPHDLSKLLRGQGKVAHSLAADEEALKGLVTNLNVTFRAFNSENQNLEDTIPALDRVLKVGNPALASLNDALPSLRAFARDALPATKSSLPTINASFPFVQQARKLVSKAELRGLAKDLRPTIPVLAKLNAATVPFLDESRALSACTTDVLAPWAVKTTPDPDFPQIKDSNFIHDINHGFVALAGESRVSDANTPFFHVQQGGGPFSVVQTNDVGGKTVSFGGLLLKPEGTRPARPDHRSVFRPGTPCEKQEIPDLNASAGPAETLHDSSKADNSNPLNIAREKAAKADLTRFMERLTLRAQGKSAPDPLAKYNQQLSRLGIREANKLLKVPMQKKVHTVEDGPTR